MTMLRRALFIAAKEIKFLFRDRETYIWAFVMPVVFMYFIGTVTGQYGGGAGMTPEDRIAVAAPASAGFLADQLVERLEQNGLAVDRKDSAAALGDASRRLILPEKFTDSALRGEKTVVKLERKDQGLANDFDQFRVARAVYTVLADLVVCAVAGGKPDAAAFDRLHKTPHAVTLDVQQAGQRKQPPTGFEQAVPGIMIMFTMLSLLSGGSVSLIIERKQGLLKRLASTPISPGELLAGKWAGRLVLGVAQIVFAMIAGTLLFGMSWGPELPMILLVLFAFGALCASFGVLLGNLARSEGQGIGFSVLGTNVFAALGGLWWPIEITPRWMQSLALCLPTGWAMDAMHQLVSFRASAAAVLLQLAALAVSAVIVGWLGARTFRYQ
jgi:ABC-2 type transport system permease protein